VTEVEREVLKLFRALPYAGFTHCAVPGCAYVGYCRGVNPSSRICLVCFDEFDCRAPNWRRRRAA
jgi:hypothetical protein